MATGKPENGRCQLCGRGVRLSFHHLICRTVHSNKYFRKRFSRQEMTHRGLWLCRLCHRGIHRIIPDEKELARDYNTREALLAHEAIAKHVSWVRKQRRATRSGHREL